MKLVKGAYLAVGSHYSFAVDSFFSKPRGVFLVVVVVVDKYEDRYISTTHYKSKIGQSKEEKSYK